MPALATTYLIFIAAGLVLFVIGVAALVWLVRAGQLDDLETPALRMLADDRPDSGSGAVPVPDAHKEALHARA